MSVEDVISLLIIFVSSDCILLLDSSTQTPQARDRWSSLIKQLSLMNDVMAVVNLALACLRPGYFVIVHY